MIFDDLIKSCVSLGRDEVKLIPASYIYTKAINHLKDAIRATYGEDGYHRVMSKYDQIAREEEKK